MINDLFDNIFFFNVHKIVQIGFGTGPVTSWPPVSGFVIQDHGSADPDPKDIFTTLLGRRAFVLYDKMPECLTAAAWYGRPASYHRIKGLRRVELCCAKQWNLPHDRFN